jgi:ABC-2 type transport system ATP-binding protein
MSVAAFLKFCGRMRGLSGAELDKAYDRVVEICRLKDVLRMDVDSLSKGFRRRTCLAQSLIHHPENLVLDEPTDGLDPDQKREIRSLILELKQSTAVIVSTHILEEIGAVCDHVLAIRQGRAVFYGTATEFRKLSSDEGAVLLKLENSADPAVFEHLNEAASFTFRREPDSVVLKLQPLPGMEKVLVPAALSFAESRNYRVLECDILHADPGDIFAKLGNKGDVSC